MAGRGEDGVDLPFAETEMCPELIDVLLLGEDDGDDGLLGIRVRGVHLGLDGDVISRQQDQNRHNARNPRGARRPPLSLKVDRHHLATNSTEDRTETPSRQAPQNQAPTLCHLTRKC